MPGRPQRPPDRRASPAAHGRVGYPDSTHVGHGLLGHGRDGVAGAERVDAHAAVRPLGNARARILDHAGLGRVVVGMQLRPVDDAAGHGGDVDDRSAAVCRARPSDWVQR